MSEKSKRTKRIADLLQQEIAAALKKEINDPRLKTVVITAVDMSPDLRNAKVYYALLDPAQKDAVKVALEKGAGFLRHIVAQNVELRYMPVLKFYYDDTLVRAQTIHHLINKTNVTDDTPDDEE